MHFITHSPSRAGFSLRSNIQFNRPVSLVSLNLEHLPLHFFIFYNIDIFKEDTLFPLLFFKIESSSFWICLMFPRDQIQDMHFWPAHYMGDDGSFSGEHICNHRWQRVRWWRSFPSQISVLQFLHYSYIQSTHTQTLIHTYICAHISINKSKQIHLTPVHPQRACSSSLCICPCPVTSLAPLLTHILNPVAHPLHVQTSFTCCCNKQACKKSSGFVCNSLFLLCHPRMGSSVKNSAHNQLGSILFFFSSG